MPYSGSRRMRERRLRAKYRRNTAITGVVSLVLGLIVGFVLCVVSVSHPGIARNVLKIGPLTDGSVVSAGDTLAINEPDEDASYIGGLTDYERNEVVDSPDGTFDEFVAQNMDAINAFAAEEANGFADSTNQVNIDLSGIIAAIEAEENGETAPVGDADINAPVTEPDVQVTVTNVSEEPAEPVAEVPAEEPAETPVEEPTEEPVEEPAEAPAEEPAETPAEEPTEAPTEEPTAEPTVEVTPEPTPEVVEPVIVPYGQSYSLQTQIKADGSERSTVNDDPYETLNLTLKVDAYKDPTYFQQQYATMYKLQGDEAAVEFDLTLNGYTGTTEIIPQNLLLITFVGRDPSLAAQGYQLMDAEIGGKTEIAISSDVPTKLYKRYPYSAEQGDMVYMVVTTYNDGVESVYWFEILAPEPEETPVPEEAAAEGSSETSSEGGISLTVGSQGDDVIKLQRALIDLGLLKGSPDGKFGNYTASAVKEMQKRYGMEETGIANQAFLDRLYQGQ